MTVQEGNKLIDVFLGEDGFLGKEYEEHYSDEFWRPTKHKYQSEDLQYHTSWDWLMPVVEKIAALKKDGIIKRGELPDSADAIFGCYLMCSKEFVWQAVIQFITWYNQNK